jgi:hypothetical protein
MLTCDYPHYAVASADAADDTSAEDTVPLAQSRRRVENFPWQRKLGEI